MKVDLEKLHKRFNKRWIGRLYGYSIFFIFSAFGGIIGFALETTLGYTYIYIWIWILVIGYAIALPIGYIRSYIKKNYIEDLKDE